MTEQQKKELYDALDYDEKTALAESFNTPRDAMKARIVAKLNKGSFALRSDPHGKVQDVISVVFDIFQATFIQRPDNFEASISLAGFSVFDGTTTNTLYPQIVQVKETRRRSPVVAVQTSWDDAAVDPEDPFFFLKFEMNPLDDRADTALTVRMRHMEIIYHKGYVEAVYRFLKPPASHLESVEALLVRAMFTLSVSRRHPTVGNR
jgi:vacuolar protein sorting-associated protein 13A/C